MFVLSYPLLAQVGERDWRLGVARSTAARRGYHSLNTESGYLTLRLERGQELKALTVPATPLPAAAVPHPRKVRAYLLPLYIICVYYYYTLYVCSTHKFVCCLFLTMDVGMLATLMLLKYFIMLLKCFIVFHYCLSQTLYSTLVSLHCL